MDYFLVRIIMPKTTITDTPPTIAIISSGIGGDAVGSVGFVGDVFVEIVVVGLGVVVGSVVVVGGT